MYSKGGGGEIPGPKQLKAVHDCPRQYTASARLRQVKDVSPEAEVMKISFSEM
jgi:hypothetical protein